MKSAFRSLPIHACAVAFSALVSMWVVANPATATPAAVDSMRLPDHVLPALAHAARAAPADLAQSATTTTAPLSLTFVLKRDDEAGFRQFLHDVYDPASPNFRRFLSQAQLADRFGPSQADYQQVLDYLQTQGFRLTEGSANRMTLTVSGSRAQAEQAFGVHIDDYQLGSTAFHANDTDPALPPQIAARVQSVSGLSDLARPQPEFVVALFACTSLLIGNPNIGINGLGLCIQKIAFSGWFFHLFGGPASAGDPAPGDWVTLDGTGQKIGLLEFDSFNATDVTNYLALIGAPATRINQLGVVSVNGGVPPGASQEEVLLDINTVMDLVPGANVVVYDAPFSTGYAALFNAMINDHDTVISNSWSSCEDQTTEADVKSIDAVLQQAAASGISVFNGAGDTGSNCLDGAANTIGVPADSPNATAVGGTSPTAGPGITYGGETWWNGTAANPPSGQGGYGVSRFFARPAYQNGLNPTPMRSIPDLVSGADPASGMVLCQANAGGCPTGLLYGGTSYTAPQWAAFAAVLNEAHGSNIGAFNAVLYPLANSGGFHSAASMGSDFAHVGLGSPNLDVLHLLLDGKTVGTPSAATSEVTAFVANGMLPVTVAPFAVPADGMTRSHVVVRLRDAATDSVPGKTITLTANGGSHATIAPGSGVTTVDNGAVVFTLTDLTPETITLTARDTTDNLTLTQTANVVFGVPTAASGSIVAFTDAVPADGKSTDTITVTLQDALGRPTPGKLVTLQQTGNSVITMPSPAVTNTSGQIAFTVTDTVQEAVTYTATDVTDGNLPVPGSAAVTFNAGGGDNCGITNLGQGSAGISPGPGYAMTPYATGFVPLNTNYGGLTDGCRGASGLAFDGSGNLYVSDLHSGNIYKFPPGGGTVGPSTLLTPTALGPLLESLTFGKDGKFYGARNATTGNFFTGAVIQIDPVTGAFVRNVSTSTTCASFVVTDPASGDLFVNDSCSGAGSDNGSVWRISNPGGAAPTTSVYAATPGVNGGMSFASGGTLYMLSYLSNGGAAGVVKITGTGSSSPGQVSVLPGITAPDLGIVALGQQSNGDALSVILAAAPGSDGFPPGIRSYDITTNPVSTTSLVTNNAYANVQIIGPDGCMYASMNVAVYRITNADGSCPLVVTQSLLTLSPAIVSPNPTQGGTQSFSATFHNVSVPAGTLVFFQVTGANAQTKLAYTNSSGIASFNENGVNAGSDTVVATATVGTTKLTSNPAQVTWNAGPHTTFLNLNTTPTAAEAAKSATLSASLYDVSVSPSAPISGAALQFTVDGQSCNGTTNAAGVASCNVTVPAVGSFTLTVSYAGASNYLPAVQSQLFSTTDLIFANGFEPPL